MISIGLSQTAYGAYYYTADGKKIIYNTDSNTYNNYYSLSGAKIQPPSASNPVQAAPGNTNNAPAKPATQTGNTPSTTYVTVGNQKIYYQKPASGTSNYYPIPSSSGSTGLPQGAGQTQNPPDTNPAQQTPGQSGAYQLTSNELKLIELINRDRTKAGLKPLTIDYQLSRVARIKSEDMNTNKYFSHDSPTYGSPFAMMKNFGITYKSAAENIGKTYSVESAHSGFMNSEGHRANILNPSYTHIGVGISGSYYTEMFIKK